jgi:hypothetical protein
MITGTDDHDPPETMITINWIERSRWSGIGDHDRPECAKRTGLSESWEKSVQAPPFNSDYLSASSFVGAPLSPACAFQIKFFESAARWQTRFFSSAPSEYAFPFK